MPLFVSCWLVIAFAVAILAQFPPQPEGLLFKHLQDYPGVSISYKETFICETQARGWAGYVHIPATYLTDIETDEPYDANLFFWYFESRTRPRNAPTAIYLAGGPGYSSVSGALAEGGPCGVLEDSNTTVTNLWSWNNNVNLLYIDQPVSTGYSYTKRVEGTFDPLFLGSPTGPVTQTGITPFEAYEGDIPPENATFLYGTFSEQNAQKTANSTLSAAKTLWHFCQFWFSSFPEYDTTNKNVNIFGNSYGGYWVPVTAQYILQQNSRIEKGEIEGITIPINTVGWTNGCVDQLIQGEWYPDMAYNNTYGLQVISQGVYEKAKHNFFKFGGCRDLILECREAGALYDPENLNTNVTVNELCVAATEYCEEYVVGPYDAHSYRSDDDLTHLKPDPSPPSYWQAFVNREWVLQALGVPVNSTSVSALSNNIFYFKTGDPVRTAGVQSVNYLLESGVKVAMIYGDRDYRCPWNGAEKLSLAADWSGAENFRNAGYEYIQTNSSYQGGVVRQSGNLSFSRVFQAGHSAQAYQPETVFRLFNRAIFDKDLATGEESIPGSAASNYATSGPSSSFGIKNELPLPPPPACILYAVGGTCTQEQYDALEKGTAVIMDFNIVKPKGGSPGGIGGVL